jgi:hypothetical protein
MLRKGMAADGMAVTDYIEVLPQGSFLKFFQQTGFKCKKTIVLFECTGDCKFDLVDKRCECDGDLDRGCLGMNFEALLVDYVNN